VINISCNESEVVMANLRLCMSSPGSNCFVWWVGGPVSRTDLSHVLVSSLSLMRFCYLLSDGNASTVVHYSVVFCTDMFIV
jgi:hypothetical protein